MVPRLLILTTLAKVAALALWVYSSYRAAAVFLFFVPDPFIIYALFAPSAQGLCRVFTHFETETPAVWLTIDDGPDEHDTPRILDLLDRYKARATFFVIGERAARWPHL